MLCERLAPVGCVPIVISGKSLENLTSLLLESNGCLRHISDFDFLKLGRRTFDFPKT